MHLKISQAYLDVIHELARKVLERENAIYLLKRRLKQALARIAELDPNDPTPPPPTDDDDVDDDKEEKKL